MKFGKEGKYMHKADGVIIGRVSSQKQGLRGDSHEDQNKTTDPVIKRVELQDNVKINIVKTFELVESASGDIIEIQPLFTVLQELKRMSPVPRYAFLKSVDRVSRGGGDMVLLLKKMYLTEGIMLYDAYGMINHTTINTLEHLNRKYKWSQKNPTDIMLYLSGEMAKDDVSGILTRLIGAEITYTRLGYSTMDAPFGLKNKKLHTEHGRRTVWEMHETEGRWVVRIFELSAEGYDDEQIIKIVNEMGYKTRIKNRYASKDKARVIGKIGGLPLDRKQLDRLRWNPVYAGYMKHEWLDGKIVKTRHFDGIIDVDLWNKANSDKYTLLVDRDEARIVEKAKDLKRVRKDPHNPLFPFKNVVGCPVCSKPLNGSSPRNGSGGHTRTYSHGWGHEFYGINADKLEKQIYKFIENIEFKEKYAIALRRKMLGYLEAKRSRILESSVDNSTRLKEIQISSKNLSDKIEMLSSIQAIKMMEEKLDALLVEETEILKNMGKQKEEKEDVQVVINRVMNYLEHIGETLLDQDDTKKLEGLFAILFDERPTVADLYFGTAKLACVFKLKGAFLDEINAQIPLSEPDGIRTCDQELKRLLLYR
jgi:hypothetical protein